MNTVHYVVYREGVIWRFNLVASNGQVLFTSTNRYGRKQAALDGIKVIAGLVKGDPKVLFGDDQDDEIY